MGPVAAAIRVTGPSEHVTGEQLPRLIKLVEEHASAISYRLGYDVTNPY